MFTKSIKLKQNGMVAMTAGKYEARFSSYKQRVSGDILVLVCHMIL